jgi:hypothetical protein
MAHDPALIRQVRLLVPDTDAIYGPTGSDYLFSDDDVDAFLTLGHGNSKWAAGLAKIAVGGSEALILKVVRNYETSTDGATLMRQWTLAGQALIEEARLDIEAEAEAGGFFYIVSPPSLDEPLFTEAVPRGYGW